MTSLPSTSTVVACCEEAQKELARCDERGNWWAKVHLADAAKELAALRRLVDRLPQRV